MSFSSYSSSSSSSVSREISGHGRQAVKNALTLLLPFSTQPQSIIRTYSKPVAATPPFQQLIKPLYHYNVQIAWPCLLSSCQVQFFSSCNACQMAHFLRLFATTWHSSKYPGNWLKHVVPRSMQYTVIHGSLLPTITPPHLPSYTMFEWNSCLLHQATMTLVNCVTDDAQFKTMSANLLWV